MELLFTDTHLILKKNQFSIWFKRNCKLNFEHKLSFDFTKLKNFKCLGIAYTLIGFLQENLIFTAQNYFVGKLPNSFSTDLDVYMIKKIILINLNSDLDLLSWELGLDVCPIHAKNLNYKVSSNSCYSIGDFDSNDSLKKNDQFFSRNFSENSNHLQSYSIQKTWNSIKSTSEKYIYKTSNNPASSILFQGHSKEEKRLFEEIFKMFNDSDSFFYCENGDIFNSLQRKNEEDYLKLVDSPIWKKVDDRFFFNKYLLKFLLNDKENENFIDVWITPILQGFIQVEDCRNKLEGFCQNNKNSDEIFKIFLISRRSRFRAGTRYKRRGLDEDGKCANYVETEQVVKLNKHLVSFVQTRGSIPVFWTQPGNAYRPTPIIEKNLQDTQIAFNKHFDEELKIYKNISIVNLINKKGREGILGDAYLKCFLEYKNQSLNYISFDFHHHCQGLKFENISILINKIKSKVEQVNYFWEDENGIICRQSGTFRSNCVDCLDRTNLVQSFIAKHVLSKQLLKLAFLYPDHELPISFRNCFQQIWANNGDAISRQYAGTSALKGDFTRTGERRFKGLMKDSYNSASRYYLNRFKDAERQIAIDIILGNPVNYSDLNSQNLNINFDLDCISSNKNKIIKLIQELINELNLKNILCYWLLNNVEKILFYDQQVSEVDCVLILTKEAYYIANLNETSDSFLDYEKIFIKDVFKLEIGPYFEFETDNFEEEIKRNYSLRINFFTEDKKESFHWIKPSILSFYDKIENTVFYDEFHIQFIHSIKLALIFVLKNDLKSLKVFDMSLDLRKSNYHEKIELFNKVLINENNKILSNDNKLDSLNRNYLLKNSTNLSNLKNASKNAINNVSSQFFRFKNKLATTLNTDHNLPHNQINIENEKSLSQNLICDSFNHFKVELKKDFSVLYYNKLNEKILELELAELLYSFEKNSICLDLDQIEKSIRESNSNIVSNLEKRFEKDLFLISDHIFLKSCGILITSIPKNSEVKVKKPISKKLVTNSYENISNYNSNDVFISLMNEKNELNQNLVECLKNEKKIISDTASKKSIKDSLKQKFAETTSNKKEYFLNSLSKMSKVVQNLNVNKINNSELTEKSSSKFEFLTKEDIKNLNECKEVFNLNIIEI